jgi:hypothetical protein
VISSLHLRSQSWKLVPRTPPKDVDIVEITLPLLPADDWTADTHQLLHHLCCSMEWKNGLPSPRTNPDSNPARVLGLAVHLRHGFVLFTYFLVLGLNTGPTT